MARKILLADDSVTAQNMGRKILADAGYEVVTVNNGSAALKKVNEAKPDIIVLDVYMPGYSGLEVCQRLKEVNETARIPILLTVGKLEPFKPEEAKRARADAFIVKPFEATELLSVLSKLEDKIVPRAEASKPGRFARAIAAVEEGRYDKSMAADPDEDSGWKNRIAFPSRKKKEKAAEEESVDDPGFYNPVNKDLRTTVEHSFAPKPEPAKEEAPRVDLGALAPHLPKDVTAEEIAALAAAAAQIKGTAETKPESESRAAEAPTTEARPAEASPAEIRAAETEVAPPPVIELAKHEPVTHEPATQAAAPAEVSAEATPATAEGKQETPAVEVAKEAAAPPVEAAAEKQKEKDKVEIPPDKPSEAAPEQRTHGLPYPATGELTGAIMALPLGTYVSLAPSSGNGSSVHAEDNEPITMAAAAGAEYVSPASRWMAVPVALLPEEAAISLEQEMQKTYAALAAAEMAHTAPQEPMAQSQPVAVMASPVETPAAETPAPEPAGFLPEVARTIGSVASQAAEAIKAAVKEFETVATSVVESKAPVAAKPEAAPAQATEPVVEAVAEPKVEAPPAVEAKVEEKVEEKVEAKTEEQPVAESVAAEPEPAPAQAAEPEAPSSTIASPTIAPEPVAQEQKAEPERSAEAEQAAEPKQEEPQPAMEAAVAAPAEVSSSGQEPETVAPAPASEIPTEPIMAREVAAQITESSEPTEPAAGGTEDMAKKEQEIAATTAAAWASWRRIRETGPKGHSAAEASKKEAAEEVPAPEEKDEAAMAVAAGAEKAPEEVPAEGGAESAEIASIVDSVLADLRPKIVEEISKKLKKKK